MPQETEDEFRGLIVCHIQPNQAVIRVRPIRAIEISIQAEKSGLREAVQDRNQILIVGAARGYVHANDTETQPPLTQQ